MDVLRALHDPPRRPHARPPPRPTHHVCRLRHRKGTWRVVDMSVQYTFIRRHSEEVGVLERGRRAKLLASALLSAPPKFFPWYLVSCLCYTPDQQIRFVIKLMRLTVEHYGSKASFGLSTKRTQVRILCCGVKTFSIYTAPVYSAV